MRPAPDFRHTVSVGRRSLVLVFLGGLFVLTPGPACARRPGGTRVSQLRLEGYLGAPRPGQAEEADLTLRWDAKDHRFQVTAARLFDGNLAATILDEVRPNRPNFILRGPPELLRRLDGAKPGVHVTIIGQYRSGAPDLFVGRVDVEGEGT